MHFIMNNIGNIIAADKSFLASLNLNLLDDLKKQLILNELQIISSENKIDLKSKNKTISYKTKCTSLSSDFGELTLTQCFDEWVEEIPKDKIALKTIPNDSHVELPIPKVELPEIKSAEINLPEVKIPNTLYTRADDVIEIDSKKISQDIGISIQDYKKFFYEYKETAISLKSKLQSQNDPERIDTIHTIKELSNVLKLPLIDGMMDELKLIPTYNSDEQIDIFYTTLSKFRLEEKKKTNTQLNNSNAQTSYPDSKSDIGSQLLQFNNFVDKTSDSNKEPEVISLETKDKGNILSHTIDKMKSITLEEETPTKATLDYAQYYEIQKESTVSYTDSTHLNKIQPVDSNKDLDLTNIFPISFVYNIREVSEELGLPLELMIEFVQDFIDQSHYSTPKLLQAYKDNDIESIQDIGRFLKDGSKNLRILPLANSLQNLQDITNTSQMNILIKDYWAHFLSLEKQIKSFSI